VTELRIGDADREAAVRALGEHYAAGRLTKEEFDERADLAWAAKTGSALQPLFADLPRAQAARPVAPAPAGRAPDLGPGWFFVTKVLLALVLVVALMNKPVVFLLLFAAWLVLGRHHWSRGRRHHRLR
jgi:hypothetical protein